MRNANQAVDKSDRRQAPAHRMGGRLAFERHDARHVVRVELPRHS